MTITLTGENDFLRKAELDKLAAEFVAEHGDMAVERFDGDESDAARMRGSLASLPFLSARKLVVLNQPGKQKVFAEDIQNILKEAAETTDLIIIEPKLDKRTSYYKALKKMTDFREFGELDASGLARWVVQYAKEQGGAISSADAQFLVERIGANQQMLRQELDKLLVFEPKISRPNIELLTEPMPQSTVFELLDAAFSGNTRRAIELYREQRALKVEPQAIIAMLAWQLHMLALVKAAGSRPPEQIAKEAKLKPFTVKKTQSLARNLSSINLKKMIQDLLALDLKLKTTATNPDEVLEFYLLKSMQ